MLTPLPKIYDYLSFTLTNGQSDYDVKDSQATLFNRVPTARRVVIFTDQNISFKFNDTSFPAVVLNIGDSPFQSPENMFEIDNIFLSNASGSDATVIIWLI